MAAPIDTWLSTIKKSRIKRQFWETWAMTWADIAYDWTKSINDELVLKVDKVSWKSLVLDTEITKLWTIWTWAKLASVVAWTNVTIDNTDPANPIISSTWAGWFSEIRIQDYSWPAIIGILWQYDASRAGILTEVTLISDTLPVGSNVIAELRKNSTTVGNVLSTTLQITTTEAATNGRYVGTPVTTFSSSAIADWDVFYLYLTSVGSPEALNVRAILRYT